MLESNSDFRAKFVRAGEQKSFIFKVRERVTVTDVAQCCNCSERTIRDWQRERFNMDYSCLVKLCKRFNLSVPEVKKIHRYDHAAEAGRKGGNATIRKYGKVPADEERRSTAWKHWWNETGKHDAGRVTHSREIIAPPLSEDLAEFIGIMLGDGTVSKNHIAVTLHALDDRSYSTHVILLVKHLFGVDPKVYDRKNRKAIAITVARKRLVEYLIHMGLPSGDKNKNGAKVPDWILGNEQYAKACMRGLFDTDGTVFDHRYKSKSRLYVYKKISFSSASEQLRNDVHLMLQSFGITSCHSGTNVRIDSRASFEQYYKTVGFHNPKHLKRASK